MNIHPIIKREIDKNWIIKVRRIYKKALGTKKEKTKYISKKLKIPLNSWLLNSDRILK